MENLEPNQIVLLAAAIAGLVVIGITLYFRSAQKQIDRDQSELNASKNDLEIRLALSQQSEEQLHQQVQELKSGLDQDQQRINEMRESLHTAEKDNRALKIEQQKDRELSEQRLKQFEENREQLKVEFENLAGKILDEKAKVFSKNSQSSIESLLKPFREQIEGFQKRVNDVHTDSVKGNAALESEIKKVLEIGLKMGKEAQNLTSALKGDSQKRGGWGEAQLEKTLEMSGLIAGAHFEKQS